MTSVKLITFLFAILAIATTASASGIKVTPSKINLDIKANEPASKNITISNPTSDVQIFKIYPDDFADSIKINPASFTLESGSEKNITVTIKIAGDQKGTEVLSTNLSIIAKPLAEMQFQTNAGVKIPLTITVSESNILSQPLQPLFYTTLFIVLFAIIKFIFFLRRKNKTMTKLPS